MGNVIKYVTEPFVVPTVKAWKATVKGIRIFCKNMVNMVEAIKNDMISMLKSEKAWDFWSFFGAMHFFVILTAIVTTVHYWSLIPIIIYLTSLLIPTYVIAFHARKKYKPN